MYVPVSWQFVAAVCSGCVSCSSLLLMTLTNCCSKLLLTPQPFDLPTHCRGVVKCNKHVPGNTLHVCGTPPSPLTRFDDAYRGW